MRVHLIYICIENFFGILLLMIHSPRHFNLDKNFMKKFNKMSSEKVDMSTQINIDTFLYSKSFVFKLSHKKWAQCNLNNLHAVKNIIIHFELLFQNDFDVLRQFLSFAQKVALSYFSNDRIFGHL